MICSVIVAVPLHIVGAGRFGRPASRLFAPIRICFYPASHPATPAPFGASPGPVVSFRWVPRSRRVAHRSSGHVSHYSEPLFLCGFTALSATTNGQTILPGLFAPGFGGFSFRPCPLSARRRGCSCACLPLSFGLFTSPAWVVHPHGPSAAPLRFSCTRAQFRPRSLSGSLAFSVRWPDRAPPARVGLYVPRLACAARLTYAPP